MATYQDVMTWLELFFLAQGNKHGIHAEHDVIYAAPGVPPERFLPHELQKLENAGWHWDKGEEHWYLYP